MTYAIPDIADEKLEELFQFIKPVVSKDGELWYIEPCDLRREAFTWDAKPTYKAENLAILSKIKTLHTYGYYGMFKPSIAEVLSQIPEELLKKTIAFSVRGPEDVHDLHLEKEALNAGFHLAITTLYANATTLYDP